MGPPSFIKIHQAVLEKNLKMWKVYTRTGRLTENGRRVMTIAHLSPRLRWATRRQIKLMEDFKRFYTNTKRKCELHPFNTLIYQYLMIINYILSIYFCFAVSTSSLPSFLKIHRAVLEKSLKMWKVYRWTGGWTDNGRCDMTITLFTSI